MELRLDWSKTRLRIVAKEERKLLPNTKISFSVFQILEIPISFENIVLLCRYIFLRSSWTNFVSVLDHFENVSFSVQKQF